MSVLQHTPRFEAAEALRLASQIYGLQATASPLPSERDQNFRLDTAGGVFVLKIANAGESRAMLEAENAALSHVASRGGRCARVVGALDGSEIAESGGHLIRLLTWIPGTPLGSLARHSPSLFEDFGRALGEFDRALSTFDHPALHRRFYWDLAAAFQTIREYLPAVRDNDWRNALEREAQALERRHDPAALRRSVIHNDANDYNVVAGGGDDLYTRNQRVAGIIDFGDLVHSFTVADLAVASAYAVLDKPDPIAAAIPIVRGYHSTYPLLEQEISQLMDLVRLRLCLSACIAAHQSAQRPDDDYLSISQAPIRRTFPRLTRIHPRFAEAVFRDACGLPPVPLADRVRTWLQGKGRDRLYSHVVGRHDREVVIDLSFGSPLVPGNPLSNPEPALTERIQDEMRAAGASLGIGRYGEARIMYWSPLFAGDTPDAERRTVHLGLDLFAPAGTPVHAPLPGTVYDFADNRAPGDYGPLIVLQHETDAGDRFFTLYGHLSRESLDGLERGRRVAAGERLAWLGSADVNGGWHPHLHLQLIVDLLDRGCDYPGVCHASTRRVWCELSPDPNLLLQRTADVLPDADAPKARTLAARQAHLGRNLSIGYRTPLTVSRGWMQYLYDDRGGRYLDAYNNVPHVGHSHPRVARAAALQLGVLNTNTRYLHESLGRFAERLTATLPAPLRVCYFVNSGSEANELALRLARAHTRRRDVIVLESAYHGNTTTLTEISPYKFDGPGGAGRQPWVHTVPIPDVFRGPFKKDDPEAGRRYADGVRHVTEALRAQGSAPSAFIAETCPSVGGQIVFPPGYLAAVYAHVRAAGGVCIADEVQTAYGRMGSSFYAFEDQAVVPDIVVLGKPIGNGYPLGAVVTTDEIAASFANGMEFFSTFGGSTVSCAVGHAVLDVVEQEELQSHAADVGNGLLAELRPLVDEHPIVGDVRGSGLFLGVELVKDRGTLEPARAEAEYVVNRLREEGILIGTDGPSHNVLKIRPPMPFDNNDGERLVSTMKKVLRELL